MQSVSVVNYAHDGRIKVFLDNCCAVLYFYSNELSRYETYDFRKFPIFDAFKHVRLQKALNRGKVHQILRLMVDYACCLVKCINYQNVMCIQKIYFLQDHANSCKLGKTCNILARILQEGH